MILDFEGVRKKHYLFFFVVPFIPLYVQQSVAKFVKRLWWHIANAVFFPSVLTNHYLFPTCFLNGSYTKLNAVIAFMVTPVKPYSSRLLGRDGHVL